MSKIYIRQPGDQIKIVEVINAQEDDDVIAQVGGGTIVTEAEARTIYRNQIRLAIQAGIVTADAVGLGRSALLSLVNSLPAEVKDLVGQNFIDTQLNTINTGGVSTP